MLCLEMSGMILHQATGIPQKTLSGNIKISFGSFGGGDI